MRCSTRWRTSTPWCSTGSPTSCSRTEHLLDLRRSAVQRSADPRLPGRTVHSGYFDFSMPQGEIKSDTPMWHGPAVFNTLTAPPILDAVESIIGPAIYSNPVQHVRLSIWRLPTTPATRLSAPPPGTRTSAWWHPSRDAHGVDTRHADERAGCLHLVLESRGGPGPSTAQARTHRRPGCTSRTTSSEPWTPSPSP